MHWRNNRANRFILLQYSTAQQRGAPQLLDFLWKYLRSNPQFHAVQILLLFVQMSSTLKYLRLQVQSMVGQIMQFDEEEQLYKGPWIRSAQQRLFQVLESDYSFPRAICRSLVDLMFDFITESIGGRLHEGQITYYAASSHEPPGKRLSQIKSVPVHLTFHDRNDMAILSVFADSILTPLYKEKPIRF